MVSSYGIRIPVSRADGKHSLSLIAGVWKLDTATGMNGSDGDIFGWLTDSGNLIYDIRCQIFDA